jgi:hypothetical protein
MATTTNYGWTTPDDTALVKDGASAIRSLGTSVDTTTKNLNPETTLGDIAYRSSTANVNTRLPLGTAGQVLKVNSGATAPEWATDASGMTNPMTTTGDTIYSSSGSTPARLAIGSTGNVLTVAGGVPTWAAPSSGALTLITTSTFSAVSSHSVSTCFSSTYRNYLILGTYTSTNAGTLSIRMRSGSTDNTSGSYRWNRHTIGNGTTNTVASDNSVSSSEIGILSNSSMSNFFNMTISSPQVAAETFWQSPASSTQNTNQVNYYGSFNATNDFDGFTIIAGAGTITGRVSVYGYAV